MDRAQHYIECVETYKLAHESVELLAAAKLIALAGNAEERIVGCTWGYLLYRLPCTGRDRGFLGPLQGGLVLQAVLRDVFKDFRAGHIAKQDMLQAARSVSNSLAVEAVGPSPMAPPG